MVAADRRRVEPGNDRPTRPVTEGGEDGVQIGVDIDIGSSCHGLDTIYNNMLVQVIR